MTPLSILIADDHEVVRRGLALVLNLEKNFNVVGEAQDGLQAIAEADRLHPDVVLLDLKMPVMDGRAAAMQIKSRHPGTYIILLSGAEIDEGVFEALESGVDGYVSKEVSPQELARAISLVASGKRYIDASVTTALLKRVRSRPSAALGHAPQLTHREEEILQWMATPSTYREIGDQLYISEETVRSHVKNILAKLEKPNRTQAVIEAIRLGLIEMKPE